MISIALMPSHYDADAFSCTMITTYTVKWVIAYRLQPHRLSRSCLKKPVTYVLIIIAYNCSLACIGHASSRLERHTLFGLRRRALSLCIQARSATYYRRTTCPHIVRRRDTSQVPRRSIVPCHLSPLYAQRSCQRGRDTLLLHAHVTEKHDDPQCHTIPRQYLESQREKAEAEQWAESKQPHIVSRHHA